MAEGRMGQEWECLLFSHSVHSIVNNELIELITMVHRVS